MNDARRSFGGVSVDDLVAVVVVLALTAIGLAGFESSYGGTHFMVVGVIAAVLGAAIAVGTKLLGLGGWLSTLIALALYVLIGGVLALPDRSVAVVLPSVDTMRLSVEQAVVGWKELITITPPVGRTGDLMVIPVACGFAAAFAGATLALRLRVSWPAVVPPAIVGGLSILTGVNQPAAPVIQGVSFAAIAVGWLAWREHRRRPLLGAPAADRSRAVLALALLVLAFGAGHAVADSLPFASDDRDIWRRTVTPPFDPREHPSPLAGYRAFIKAEVEDEDPVLFTVEGVPSGIPVRLATMDAYDGLVWQVSAGDPDNPSLRSSGSFVRVGEEVAPDFGGEVADVTVEVEQYSDLWVPTVGEVESLRFTGSIGGTERDRELNDAFRYNLGTDTAAAPLRLEPGDRYVMRVRLPAVVPELDGFEITPEVAQLPRAAQVSAISEALLTPELLEVNDPGTRLDRVREAFVDEGVYSDGDTDSDQLPSRSGHSVARLVDFVDRYPDEQLIGNAEQFAATYALLFRELGLPTRVVMGFRPSESSEAGPVEVRAGDVDAWVEVPVNDLGWVDIAPTPDRDQIGLTDLAPQQPEPEYRTQNPPPPPLLDPEFENPATARGDVSATEDEEENEEDDEPIVELSGSGGNLVGRLAAASLVGTVLVALLVVVGVMTLKRIRRARRRRRGAPHVRIAHGWNEVTDLAVDMGRPVPATTTRREAAGLVGGSSLALARRADAAVWGDGEPTEDEVEEFWSDLESYLADARKGAGVVGALRAGASAKSLRRRPSVEDPPPDDRDHDSRPGDAARPVRELRDAGSAEAVIEFDGTYAETVAALHEVAEDQGFSIVASGPGTFRLERLRRPRWAKVMTVLLLPVAGLGLVFLLVRRRDAAVVSVIDDRDRPRIRVMGTTDDVLVHSIRSRSEHGDPTESVDATTAGPARSDDTGDVAEPAPPPAGATHDLAPPTDAAERVSDARIPDTSTRVVEPAAPTTRGATIDSSDPDADRAADSAFHAERVPESGAEVTRIESGQSPEGSPDEEATVDRGAGEVLDAADLEMSDESTIVRPATRARRTAAPRLVLPDGGTIDVGSGVVIGRDPAAPPPYNLFEQWTTTDPSVSRTHVAVTVEEGALRVVDLGSSNGTKILIDGNVTTCEPGQPETAGIGTTIEVGDLHLRVERPSA